MNMNRMLRDLSWLAVSSSLCACASMLIGTPEWFEANSYGKKALSERASFDLSCPAGEVQFACVGPGSNCSSVGASGCEKKAVYVFVADKWVMNSEARAAR
jgi:hypothetical protein